MDIMDMSVRTSLPKDMPVGMAYVPFQQWDTPYEGAVGYSRGTIFKELDLPFIGEEAVPNANRK